MKFRLQVNNELLTYLSYNHHMKYLFSNEKMENNKHRNYDIIQLTKDHTHDPLVW